MGMFNLNGFARKLLMSGIAFTLACCGAFAQSKPVLKQQMSLDKVGEVVSGSRQNVFLAKSSDTYTLIDQASKIQLGSMQIDDGSLAIPGMGKMYLWGDSSFLLSTGEALLKADVISGKTDTLFGLVHFPEFIINYIPLPWDENLLLIAAKTYPVGKNGNVDFFTTDKKKNAVYDDSKNCRLILFNIRKGEIVASAATPYAITAFAPDAFGKDILAGAFEGDVVKIGRDLAAKVLFHAFDRPVFSLLHQQSMIITVPHIGPKYIGDVGEGRICMYDTTTRINKELLLPEEKPVVKSEFGLNPGPTSYISRVFSLPKDNSLLVNYGFSRLLKITLPTMDTIGLPVPFGDVNFYCFNRDSTQLLATTAEFPGIFGPSGELAMYDLYHKKFQQSFKKPASQDEFKVITKLFDQEGNYHFIGQKSASYFSPDTLVVFSGNRTNPVIITCNNCKFFSDARDTSLSIRSGDKCIYGKLHCENLRLNSYSFNLGYRLHSNEDTLNADIFTVKLDTRKFHNTDIPYEVTGVHELNNGCKLVEGFYLLKTKTLFRIVVIDSSGKTVFRTPDFETGILKQYCSISASVRFMAYTYRVKDLDVLEVWDMQSYSRVFEKTFTEKLSFQFFCFDKSRDVLWYSQHNADADIDVFKLDLDHLPVKESFAFSNPGFLSFETDIGNDLVASENYNQISLSRLSDRKLLFQANPATPFFTIYQQPHGFAFASAKEFHVIQNDLSYLYFTSFTGFKPVEILNNYLYKGDKTAMDNLAFVLNRKGYAPGDYDMYFNRPDSVLLRSGSANQRFNQLAAKTVEKRKRQYPVKNLEELFSNSPVVSIVNKNAIADVVYSSEIKLVVKARSASGHPLTSVHVIDNGVPVFGNKGFAVMPAVSDVEVEVSVPLVNAMNNLQLYVSDASGLCSASENIGVVSDMAIPVPKTCFIGIGIDEFADKKYNLQYSVKDIRDLAVHLKEKCGDNITIDTLFNRSVTVVNVKEMKRKLLLTSVNDKVIIAYSGHGLLSKEYDYYLSTYSVDFEKPEQSGLPYGELEKLLDSIPARKKLLLIDACHSGEVDMDEVFAMDKTAGALGLSKGSMMIGEQPEAKFGLENSFELMQNLFLSVGKSTGATIISAAAGNQFALERGDLKNGVFTFAILEAMNNNKTLTISELKKTVGERVAQLTNGMQKPTSRSETIISNWEVW